MTGAEPAKILMEVSCMLEKEKYSFSQIMRFVIPSVIGAIVFLIPIPVGGKLNTILGIVIDWAKGLLKPWLPFTAMTCPPPILRVHA